MQASRTATHQEEEDEIYVEECMQDTPPPTKREKKSESQKNKNETPFGSNGLILARFIAIAIYNRPLIKDARITNEENKKLLNFYQNAINKAKETHDEQLDPKLPPNIRGNLTSWFIKRTSEFTDLFNIADQKRWPCHNKPDSYADPPETDMEDLLYIIQREESTKRYLVCLQEYHRDKLFHKTKAEVHADLISFYSDSSPQRESLYSRILDCWGLFKTRFLVWESLDKEVLPDSAGDSGDKIKLLKLLRDLGDSFVKNRDASTAAMVKEVNLLTEALTVYRRLHFDKDFGFFSERIFGLFNDHLFWKCINKLAIYRHIEQDEMKTQSL